MAATLPNTDLPAGVWVDLYDATGIPVGTKISVQNIGACNVKLSADADEPVLYENNRIAAPLSVWCNDEGDPGAWAWSRVNGLVNVAVVPTS